MEIMENKTVQSPSKAQPPAWVNFHDTNGQFLCAYTVNGTFLGEMEDTLILIQDEYGLDANSIIVTIGEKGQFGGMPFPYHLTLNYYEEQYCPKAV